MTCLVLLAITITIAAAAGYLIYLRRPQPTTPPPNPTTVWEDTITALGHPDDIDTTLPDFHWPSQPAGKT